MHALPVNLPCAKQLPVIANEAGGHPRMRKARVQLALLRFTRLIVSQLASVSSLRLIPTIHSFSSLRVQRNTHGVLANPDLRQAMAPSKQKRTHTVFRASSAHRLASTCKPRFVGERVKLGDLSMAALAEPRNALPRIPEQRLDSIGKNQRYLKQIATLPVSSTLLQNWQFRLGTCFVFDYQSVRHCSKTYFVAAN